MAPMKRKANSGLTSRCNTVKKAIEGAHCEDRVKRMLANSIAFTVGTPKADRHPFNDRFVAMIEQVLNTEQARLKEDVKTKDSDFTQLTPAKGEREAVLEQAKATAATKGEELTAAKAAVTDIATKVKEASEALKNAQKAEKEGNAELDVVEGKKATVHNALTLSLGPLKDDASLDEEARNAHAKVVIDTGKQFEFDTSLLSTASQVLTKPLAERGAFDGTLFEELSKAFNGKIAEFDAELSAGAPAKAERANAVAAAEAAKTAAEQQQADLKAKAAAAKEAKAAADTESRAAAKSLSDFMPDLKTCGDSLDKAKTTLQDFIDGPQKRLAELKDFKEGDFVPLKSYYEKIDGLSCDRAVIDTCRTAVQGRGDGRVSLDDAKAVYDKIADNDKVTRCERWTLRYCLQEFNWTEAAHDWIIDELEKVPQESPAKKARAGESYYEQVDGYKCDRGILDAARTGVAGRGDGRISIEDAHAVWAKAADGNKVTNAETWTLRYCLASFKWTRAAHDWMQQQMAKGPEPPPAETAAA